MNDRFLSMLGLATRAFKLLSGEFSTEKAIKSRKAKLVLVAGDASENTKKLFLDKCKFYKIKIYICSNKEKLGKAIGKSERSSIAIMDNNFATNIEKLINEGSRQEEEFENK